MTKPDPLLPEPADPLGETLHMLRLTGTLYCRGEFTAPFAIAIPEFDGVMTFLVVTSGRCWLQIEDAEPRLLEQGSLALITHGQPHIVSSSPAVPAEPLFDLPVEKVSERYEIMRHGGGGELTRTMYGVVRFDDVAAQHLLRLLPDIIVIDGWDDDAGGWLQSTLRFIASEAAQLKPGGETVITRLADVVIIQAIRSWIDHSPEASQGWLAALRDNQIGRALASIHRAPERDWSVASLSEQVGMSRSAFSARFTNMVGSSPVRYLTEWRMQVARTRLLESAAPLSMISVELGYQSEAAFCRAFKRVFGVSPGSLRRTGDTLPMAPVR
ncbi:MAG: AraC family transcriptional regulator [Rhodospirillales bacterium]|nr:AraC family transcriptional regulator [Rhodospirillales bacterium]